jgi:hypothetical protein
MIPIFLLTYKEQDFFVEIYNDQFVEQHFRPNHIHFYVLDNGQQPKVKAWCERHGYTYYASEYNIGSAGGYNWIFKVSHQLGLSSALLMQADVEVTSAWPLLFTHQLADNFGQTHFVIWPQVFRTQLDDTVPFDRLPNLGNLVGFDPRTLHEKNCYFDENYVVTHYDDLEFMWYIRGNHMMKDINAVTLLPGSRESTQNFKLPGTDFTTRSHVIQFGDEEIRVHHAGQHFGSYDQWSEFNRPYYDLMWEQFQLKQRAPYDPARWQQFGYPAYPVDCEIDRFFSQYPELKIL